MFMIEAEVKVLPMYSDKKSDIYNPNYAEDRIKDMLRYDSGTIMSKTVEGQITTFLVKSVYYRRARWDSFGIRTRIVEMVK